MTTPSNNTQLPSQKSQDAPAADNAAGQPATTSPSNTHTIDHPSHHASEHHAKAEGSGPGRAEQAVENTAPHHVGRDQGELGDTPHVGHGSQPTQPADNQGTDVGGRHGGILHHDRPDHHAGKNESTQQTSHERGPEDRAEHAVENAGAAATGHHAGMGHHTTADPRRVAGTDNRNDQGQQTDNSGAAPSTARHPTDISNTRGTGANQPSGEHRAANVAGAAATGHHTGHHAGHHVGQHEGYHDANESAGGPVDTSGMQPPPHGAADPTTAGGMNTQAPIGQTANTAQTAGGGQTYPQAASATGTGAGVAGTGAPAAHPDATRGAAAGGTVGKGIKGILKGVHGAGEAIRGNINQGVDEAFGHHEGVAKNQGIAQQGVQQMQGQGYKGTATAQQPPAAGGNRA